MPSIHDQLSWERRMVQNGVERYRASQDNAVEGGREHETSAGSRLLKSYVIQVSDHIRLYLEGKHPEGRRRNRYAKLILAVDPDKAAMIALKAVVASMFSPVSLQSLCCAIGRRLEDELRFAQFQTNHKEYYDHIIREFERRRSGDYRYQHRVLVNGAKVKGEDWECWTNDTHFGCGAAIVSLLLEVCDLVEKKSLHLGNNRREVSIVPTQECVDWVMQHNLQMELAHPDRLPCIVKPAEWNTPEDGGYYSPELRCKTPLVKSRYGPDGKHRRNLLADADLTNVRRAINGLQATGWVVNDRVFAVMRDVWHKNLSTGMPPSKPYEVPPCPLPEGVGPKDLPEDSPALTAFSEWKAEAREVYTMEQERVSKNLSLVRTIRTATLMQQYSEFYYVYQCDFRGRVYSTTTGLSPQGTDHGKALVKFSVGKPLGESGLYWLKVHGANKWGEDKSSYADRVDWIDARREQWVNCARDPIAYREIWGEADKPYQFLAFCFEYAEAIEVGSEYVSHLAVALDGSCNGLQHFSAMLRDAVGGKAVNLTPSEKPEDIYGDVGGVSNRKLKGLRSLNDERQAGAANWLDLFTSLGQDGMKRDLPKPPVMTLPYGSTPQACTSTVFKWTMEKAPKFFEKNTTFRHALYLSPIIWESIGEVVIAARAAMDWIQQCAGILAKDGHPVEYRTPLGFPIYMATSKVVTRRIRTQISGNLNLHVGRYTGELDRRKQRQGSSPNLIHGVDATHEFMCIIAGLDEGIDSFAMIHDDFGVHACDTEKWHGIIRKTFVQLHSENNILADFKQQHEDRHGIELPPIPPMGTLVLSDVLRSPYFFG